MLFRDPEAILKNLCFILLCLIWGSGWLAIKVGLTFCPPFTFAAACFGLATLVLYGVGLARRERLIWRRRDLRGALWFGLFNGLDHALVFWAEQYVSSGLTSIINATTPFFTLVLACLLVGRGSRRLRRQGWLWDSEEAPKAGRRPPRPQSFWEVSSTPPAPSWPNVIRAGPVFFSW